MRKNTIRICVLSDFFSFTIFHFSHCYGFLRIFGSLNRRFVWCLWCDPTRTAPPSFFVITITNRWILTKKSRKMRRYISCNDHKNLMIFWRKNIQKTSPKTVPGNAITIRIWRFFGEKIAKKKHLRKRSSKSVSENVMTILIWRFFGNKNCQKRLRNRSRKNVSQKCPRKTSLGISSTLLALQCFQKNAKGPISPALVGVVILKPRKLPH